MASLRLSLYKGLQRTQQIRNIRQNYRNQPCRKFQNSPPRNSNGENPWPYQTQKLVFWSGLGVFVVSCAVAYKSGLFEPKFGEIDWDKIREERNKIVDANAADDDDDEEDEEEEEEEEVAVAEEEESEVVVVVEDEVNEEVAEEVEEEEPAAVVVEEEAVVVIEEEAPVEEEPVVEEVSTLVEEVAEIIEEVAEAVEEVAVEVEEVAKEVEHVAEVVEEVVTAIEAAIPTAVEEVIEAAVEVVEEVAPVVEEIAEKVEEIAEAVEEAAHAVAEAAHEAPVEEAPVEEAPVEEEFDVIEVEEVAEAAAATEDVPESQIEDGEDAVPSLPVAPVVPEKVQYLLIGAGTASVSAMRAILKEDPNAEILMVGAEPHGPYMRPPLSKELWFNEDNVETSQLIFNDWSGKKRTVFYPDALVEVGELAPGKPALISGTRVTRLDPTNQTVTLSSGEVVAYQKCLLAPGGDPKSLDSLKATTANPCLESRVHLFRNIAQYQQLSQELNSEAKVLVVGGGFLGSEIAYAMTRTGATVYQSFPEPGNMGRVLPKYLSNWTSNQLQAAGVNVKPESKVVSAECTDTGVSVSLNNGEQLQVDHILVAVGLEPSTDLGDKAGLEVHKEMGGFVVNAELEARSNLFVAGDAACFYDPFLGRRRVEHHDHAVVSGKLAGRNMTGAKKPYHHQSMFWSDLGPHVGYEAIGLVDSTLPTVGIWAHKDTKESEINVDPAASEKYEKGIVFYMQKNKVVGVVTWNIFGKIPIAREVIASGEEQHDFGKLAKQFDIHAKH